MNDKQSGNDGVVLVPSRVTGIQDVLKVTIFRDHAELTTSHGVVTVDYADISRRQRCSLDLHCDSRRIPVADYLTKRPWHESYLLLHSDPPIQIYMPASNDDSIAATLFATIVTTIGRGGFGLYDRG